METGRASKTALRVALRRAIHQVVDKPCVLCDPVAIPLLGTQFTFDAVRERHPVMAQRPELSNILDVLDADDELTFA